MNKQELLTEIASNTGLTLEKSKMALDATIKAITMALKNGDKVSLVGFGSFSVKEKSERLGVNPATMEKITIPAKKVVVFKAGSELKF